MNIDHGNIDSLFRSKLGAYEVAPPPDLWSKIINRRKAAALRSYALLILLVLLVLGGLAYMIYGNLLGISPQAKVQSADSPLVSESGPMAIGSGFLENAEEGGIYAAEIESLEGETDVEVPPVPEADPSRLENISTPEYSDAQRRMLRNTLLGDAKTLRAEQENLAERILIQERKRAESLTDDRRIVAIKDLDPSVKNPFSSELEVEDYFRQDVEAVSPLFSRRAGFVEGSLVTLGLEGKSNRSLFCILSRGPECFEPRIPLRYFAFDVMVGPDFFSKSLSPVTNEGTDLADLRRETESYAISYGASIRLSAVLQNGLALRAGVSANQINEKFTYVDPDHERRRVVNVLVDTIINAPNDTTFIFDTLSIIESGERIRTVYNRYQMLDVPVMIGYEHRHGNWTFTGSVGIMFNVAFRTQGEIMSASGDPVAFPDPETNGSFFRARLGMSLAGSFGAAYRINSRYSAIVEPRFIYRLKPLTLDSYPVEQNYFVFGVQAGLRYRFR